jgi:hypothetical protein
VLAGEVDERVVVAKGVGGDAVDAVDDDAERLSVGSRRSKG